MKQSINIMLQKWINPLKVPVSTFYIITFINCSLTSQRSMIWSQVNRGHRQTNPGTGAHADVLSPFPARHCRGISLNHVSSTGFSWVKHPRAPHCPGPCLMGLHWQHNRQPQLEAQGKVPCTLLRECTDCYWGWVMAGHCLGRQRRPHLYIHWHKSLLFHGALNIIWDQLFDRNCTSLCTWHFFKLIELQWEILYS